jgi:hypothetical protein
MGSCWNRAGSPYARPKTRTICGPVSTSPAISTDPPRNCGLVEGDRGEDVDVTRRDHRQPGHRPQRETDRQPPSERTGRLYEATFSMKDTSRSTVAGRPRVRMCVSIRALLSMNETPVD